MSSRMKNGIMFTSNQKMFKKELDKAGKGIASMSDQEKKNFFNKITFKNFVNNFFKNYSG